jgi:hypothetical protein
LAVCLSCTATIALAVFLVGCAAGEMSRTGSSAEGSTIPPASPFIRYPERGLRFLFTPGRRHNLQTPSSSRPDWLPTLPQNLPRIPMPDDGFRDNLALSTTALGGRQIANPV